MKLVTAAVTAVLAIAAAGPAFAVTVKNNSNVEITIGVDLGSSEKVETIGAGKSVVIDCPDGCGVTGPWGFSWMASGNDIITSDSTALVTVQEPPAKNRILRTILRPQAVGRLPRPFFVPSSKRTRQFVCRFRYGRASARQEDGGP